jgi:hypothetical protein
MVIRAFFDWIVLKFLGLACLCNSATSCRAFFDWIVFFWRLESALQETHVCGLKAAQYLTPREVLA